VTDRTARPPAEPEHAERTDFSEEGLDKLLDARKMTEAWKEAYYLRKCSVARW
jgi:hypothetical protein